MAEQKTPPAGGGTRWDHLRIKHLRLIEFIHDSGSLSGAAQRLSLSQPAVTGMVHDLEAAFGVRLFERTARGASLNDAGWLALERLRHALSSLEAARQAVTGTTATALIRVGVLPVTAVSLVPRALGMLEQQGELPRLMFRQDSVQGLVDALLDGELDCVLGVLDSNTGTRSLRELVFDPVTTDGLLIACAPSHALAGRRDPPLAALLAESWILPPGDTHTYKALETLFLSAGLPPPLAHLESSAFLANLAMAGATSLLTVAPASAVRRSEADGLVRAIAIRPLAASNPLFFITRRDGPEMESLRRLREVFRRAGAGGA